MLRRSFFFILIFLMVFILSSTPMRLERLPLSSVAAVTIEGEGNLLSRASWLFILATVVFVFLWKPSRHLMRSHLFVVLVIYSSVLLLATLQSDYFSYSFTRLFSYLVYLSSGVVGITLVSNIRDLENQQKIIFSILLGSMIVSVALVLILPNFALIRDTRFVGIYSYPNMTARIAALLILYAWLFPHNWQRGWMRILRWVITPGLFFLLILTESRSTLLGLLFAVVFYLWIKDSRFRHASLLVAPIAVLLILLLSDFLYSLFLQYLEIFRHTTSLTIEEEFLSLTGRTGLWQIIFTNFPITFLGIGYKTLFHGHNGSLILSFKPTIFGGAHNAYIEPLIETGFLGFSVLIIFLMLLYRSIDSLSQIKVKSIQQFRAMLITYFIFIISQSFLEGMFDNGNIFFWLLIYYGFVSDRLRNVVLKRHDLHSPYARENQTLNGNFGMEGIAAYKSSS